MLYISGLLSIIRSVKDLDRGLAYDTILVLFNANLVFEALCVVRIEFVIVSIPFDTLFIEAIEAHNFLPRPDSTQANGTVEILTRLEEERAVIEAIANQLRLPSKLACILLG